MAREASSQLRSRYTVEKAMDSGIVTEVTIKDREAALRQELKQWEKKFSALNDGKHPTREDIKQDAAIGTQWSPCDLALKS